MIQPSLEGSSSRQNLVINTSDMDIQVAVQASNDNIQNMPLNVNHKVISPDSIQRQQTVAAQPKQEQKQGKRNGSMIVKQSQISPK